MNAGLINVVVALLTKFANATPHYQFSCSRTTFGTNDLRPRRCHNVRENSQKARDSAITLSQLPPKI